MREIILKHALINATLHDGKASVKPVLGKVLAEKPELKKDIKSLIKEINEVVAYVNRLSLEEQKKKLEELGVSLEKKKEEEKELPPLPNAVEGKVITAFPPEPSKYPHIGHAKSAFLNHYYARKYGGKFILRFEDSNPLKVKEGYYEAFEQGLKWLGLEWDEIDFLSDHMDEYYAITEKLLKTGKAYVCTCPAEKVRKLRREMKACEHRNQPIEKNLELWEKMVEGDLKEGEANVRLKIDMSHPNAVMRDPAIMRPLHATHVRVGDEYKVWPLYDFGTALLDAWEGVTHRIRSKEFEMRIELQNYIREVCGFKNHPTIIEIARFQIEGAISSGRVIREMMSKGELMGWDDPRLVTLVALKRRGFLPQAIKDFLLETGVSKSESIVSWEVLEKINRRYVDSIANRYFAVFEPVRIRIVNSPDVEYAEAPLHPDFPERGKRKIPVKLNEVYVEKSDFEKFEGKIVRLKDLFNVRLGLTSEYVGDEIVKEMPKIHWVSVPNVKAKVVMPDAKVVEALAEPLLEKEEVDRIVQLERNGFCRVDSKEPLTLFFTHK
ncbi:MAG: glutamate--tRNA ligase [Candidatus Aenigmarchaeota archaeon]|nr:glutamate--tRNA ligase [Candidatus Aenigmarchaeota archaeon]